MSNQSSNQDLINSLKAIMQNVQTALASLEGDNDQDNGEPSQVEFMSTITGGVSDMFGPSQEENPDLTNEEANDVTERFPTSQTGQLLQAPQNIKIRPLARSLVRSLLEKYNAIVVDAEVSPTLAPAYRQFFNELAFQKVTCPQDTFQAIADALNSKYSSELDNDTVSAIEDLFTTQ